MENSMKSCMRSSTTWNMKCRTPTRSPSSKALEWASQGWSISLVISCSQFHLTFVPHRNSKVISHSVKLYKFWCGNQDGLAFPPADTHVGIYLNHPPELTINGVQLIYMLFLKHIFEECQKVLTANFLNSALTYTALSSSWRSHLETQGSRAQLYQSAIVATKASFVNWQPMMKKLKFEVCTC